MISVGVQINGAVELLIYFLNRNSKQMQNPITLKLLELSYLFVIQLFMKSQFLMFLDVVECFAIVCYVVGLFLNQGSVIESLF